MQTAQTRGPTRGGSRGRSRSPPTKTLIGGPSLTARGRPSRSRQAGKTRRALSGEEYLLASEDEREETDNEANDEAVATVGRGTDDMVQPCPALAPEWNPRGSPPPKFVMPDHQPGNGATRGLTALRDKPDGNPKIARVDHEGPSVRALAAGMKRAATDRWEALKQRMAARHGMESDEEANLEAKPPQVLTALFGLTTALGRANFKANPHQVSTALFGLTAVFGLTTGGKTHGKTSRA